MTSLGEATRIDMPLSANIRNTSVWSSSLRLLLREVALPAPWQVEPNVSFMPRSVPVSTYDAVPMVPRTREKKKKANKQPTQRTSDENRLTGELIVDGNERMVRRKCASGAFSVNQKLHRFAVDTVLFNLGDIV